MHGVITRMPLVLIFGVWLSCTTSHDGAWKDGNIRAFILVSTVLHFRSSTVDRNMIFFDSFALRRVHNGLLCHICPIPYQEASVGLTKGYISMDGARSLSWPRHSNNKLAIARKYHIRVQNVVDCRRFCHKSRVTRGWNSPGKLQGEKWSNLPRIIR